MKQPGIAWRFEWNEIAGAELVGIFVSPWFPDLLFLRLLVGEPPIAVLISWSLLRWPANMIEELRQHGLTVQPHNAAS